jgi:hypothetical protein
MRLWSIHPQYLDPQGLVALWREALLAQAVLLGKTRGYRHHPQLLRFQNANSPVRAIGTYLTYVCDEAECRGYTFDSSRIAHRGRRNRLMVTTSQLSFERQHLQLKLGVRSPEWRSALLAARVVVSHPMFTIRKGAIEVWERGGHDAQQPRAAIGER